MTAKDWRQTTCSNASRENTRWWMKFSDFVGFIESLPENESKEVQEYLKHVLARAIICILNEVLFALSRKMERVEPCVSKSLHVNLSGTSRFSAPEKVIGETN